MPIYIAHSLGGGAETALQREIARELGRGAPGVVVLRARPARGWMIELCGMGSLQRGDVESADLLEDLLHPLNRRRVIYSCGVGAGDPMSVPRLLLRLTGRDDRLELRLHDYNPISPSWNLLDRNGRYHGVPSRQNTDAAHGLPPDAGRMAVSHADWRREWGLVVDRADDIRAFSQSSAAIFGEAYGQARQKLTVQPHRLIDLPARLPGGGRSIGVLGGINRAKGGEVLQHLAAIMRNRRIVVIGEMDGQYRLPAPHVVHGRYERDSIASLARSYDVGLWLIPSVCPETFSFATHEALATGLPVLGFDLGAQGEALVRARNGHLAMATPEDADGLAREIEALFTTQSEVKFRSAS